MGRDSGHGHGDGGGRVSAFFVALAIVVGGVFAPDIPTGTGALGPVGSPTVVAIEEIFQGVY